MKKVLYHDLHVVGKSGVVVLSPNLIEEGDTLFKSDHQSAYQSHVLTNMPAHGDAIPFLLIGSRTSTSYKYKDALQAVQNYIDSLDIRRTLKDTAYGDNDYQRSILNSLTVDGFNVKMNSPETADLRKEIYRCVTSNQAIINIDGLLFTILRKDGNVTFQHCEAKDPERTYYASTGVSYPDFFFRGKAYSDKAVNDNLTKWPTIENVVFEGWPDALRVTTVESYTGLVKKKALDDLEKPLTD